MRNVFITLAALFLFTSCAKKEGIFDRQNQKSSTYFKYLENIKIKKVLEDKYVKTTVWVADLNQIDPLRFDNANENFLISVFYGDDQNNKGYDILLNEQKALKIEKIAKDDPLLEDSALKNSWADYYIYSFKKQNLKESVLKFTDENNDSLEFIFNR